MYHVHRIYLRNPHYFTIGVSSASCTMSLAESVTMYDVFFQLKCCGYTTGNSSDFKYVQFQRNPFNNELTSLFCCHSNPLTEVYNGDYTCATLAGTDRYTEVLFVDIKNVTRHGELN